MATKFGKGKKTTKTTKGRKADNPFSDVFLGSANLFETPNENLLINISLDLQAVYDLMESDMADEVQENGGYTTKDGKFYLKIKGVPIREPEEWKSHFLVIDYYKKDQGSKKKAG